MKIGKGFYIETKRNFGSTHYKSLIIDLYWNVAQVANDICPTPAAILCEPRVILCTKRIRSIPMTNDASPLFDVRVEFDYIRDNDRLSRVLEEFYLRNNSATNVNSELQFVGGGFFGDLLSKVKGALPHVATAVRGINALTQGHSGLLGRVNNLTGHASDLLSMTGHGRRHVGRPRRHN